MLVECGRQETGLGHQGVRPYLWSAVKRPEFLSDFCHCVALGRSLSFFGSREMRGWWQEATQCGRV